MRRQLGVFLKGAGPKRRDALRRQLGVDDLKLNEVLEHDWFEKDNGLYTLSSDGHVEFQPDRDE